jgi:amino acid transporter
MLLIIVIIMIAIILGIYYYTVVLEQDPKKEEKRENIKWTVLPVIGIVIVIIIAISNASSIRNSDNPPLTANTENAINNNKNDNEQTIQKAQINQEVTSEFRDFLYQTFGGGGNKSLEANWYPLIKDVKVYTQEDYNWVVISTDIYHDDEGKETALVIADAALTFDNAKINSVIVNDQNGFPLISKDNPNE